jgi:hypothetical protein
MRLNIRQHAYEELRALVIDKLIARSCQNFSDLQEKVGQTLLKRSNQWPRPQRSSWLRISSSAMSAVNAATLVTGLVIDAIQKIALGFIGIVHSRHLAPSIHPNRRRLMEQLGLAEPAAPSSARCMCSRSRCGNRAVMAGKARTRSQVAVSRAGRKSR